MPDTERPKDYRPKMIAPRLASGEKRIGFCHGLPPVVKEGIRRIADRENKSMSWVMEEVVIAFFHFRAPQYTPRKTTAPPGTPEKNVPPAKKKKKTKEPK